MEDLGVTLTDTTKSITLRKRPKLCAVDDPSFIAEDHLEGWNCWSELDRITWAPENGNKCEGATPVQAKDKDGNWLPQYTCETFTYNETNYVKIKGFTHTTVIGTEVEDSDGNGVNNEDDLCPETIEQAEIDSNGCSANQFCGKIDIPERGQRMAEAIFKCNFAEWKDDEKRPPGDCHVKRAGTRKKENFECVVRERAN